MIDTKECYTHKSIQMYNTILLYNVVHYCNTSYLVTMFTAINHSSKSQWEIQEAELQKLQVELQRKANLAEADVFSTCSNMLSLCSEMAK